MGKGSLSAQALNRKPGGRLGCLEEFVEASGCPGWSATRQAQVRENLGEHGGLFNACPEPAEGAARVVNGPTHCGQVVIKMVVKRSNAHGVR